jgi:hypothetical protein
MNKMRLYQHAARCSVALRKFLDVNPHYWPFIPLLWRDVQGEKIFSIREDLSASSCSKQINIETRSTTTTTYSDHRRLVECLKRIPEPPVSYAFPDVQKQKQRLFFEQFLATPVDQRPYQPVDLFKVAIIAVRE